LAAIIIEVKFMGRLKKGTSEKRLKLAASLVQDRPVSSRALALKMNISPNTARLLLLRLAANGNVEVGEFFGLAAWRKHEVSS
jgi:predicted ArsR family transcriptional regulator